MASIAFFGCQSTPEKKFSIIPVSESGIHFSNTIQTNDTFNVIDFYYIYNGGGVAVNDFNNDGLQDIYFSGNQVANKLYLNKGNFKFEDVSKIAGVEATDIWSQGVAVADVNQDGWQDIYVCASIYGKAQERTNKLFINKGVGKDGVPRFQEEAAKWGLAEQGHSSNAAFLDYDLDGDLDLFILNNFMDRKFPSQFRPAIVDGSSVNSDKLYQNLGNGTFRDVSQEAGILIEGYSHGLSIRDINLDGWPDIYITNDFLPNDILYINNHDGTFTNRVSDYLKHQSFSAMGNDIADINNDGLQEIMALDMLPEKNYRKKTMLLKSDQTNKMNYQKYNYDFQFIRNMLHLNMGPGEQGSMVYSEVGFMAGIEETDWSWSPIFADFDNDSYKDLVIANGFPGDVTDMDFAIYMNRFQRLVGRSPELFDTIPEVHLDNYIFRNNGDLTFTKMTRAWGFDIKTFSNGAAIGDFDNDGDLDYVINNINETAVLYKNNTVEQNTKKSDTHFMRIKLHGKKGNFDALGAKVLVYAQGQMQFFEQSLTRGFMSSVDPVIHVGLGAKTMVDSVVVWWPNGVTTTTTNLPADRELTIELAGNTRRDIKKYVLSSGGKPLFVKDKSHKKLPYFHEEKEVFDFNYQQTMPHKLSQYTPGIAAADINNDGLSDVYIGGNGAHPGAFFMQDKQGNFHMAQSMIHKDTLGAKDMGVLFFDADNDGDKDLYLVSGGIAYDAGDIRYTDRLYINDGHGQFVYEQDALLDIRMSGSCVKAADIDLDGDQDLFVGTRSKPGAYPYSEASHILVNEGGKFADRTKELCPELVDPQMITDALWTDFNNDGWPDLITVGEWIPIRFYENNQGSFVNVSGSALPGASTGWWNCITGVDLDNDGDMDYICGNLGLNAIFQGDGTHPLMIFAKDFDHNGIVDPIVVKYNSDEHFDLKPFPLATRDGLLGQVRMLGQRVKTYRDYGKSTIYDLFTKEELSDAFQASATELRSVALINDGKGKFILTPLPMEAQMAPIFCALGQDFDQDGNIDLLLAGNDYSIEYMSGRIDASNGLLLKGRGDGTFVSLKPYESGVLLPGDTKGMTRLFDASGRELIMATQNKDSLSTLIYKPKNRVKSMNPGQATWVELKLKNGQTRKVECYSGGSYLSQSSEKIVLPPDCQKVILHFAKGDAEEMAVK